MGKPLKLKILPQPDDESCGPTCLHAVYRYYEDRIPLETVVSQVARIEGGGTLSVLLACHALRRGYRAKIYTYNVRLFDPTWFKRSKADLSAKIKAQMQAKTESKFVAACRAYLDFLDLGGVVCFSDLTTELIENYLNISIPILTGLSATYLHRMPRELPVSGDDDDVRGEPSGHFVVLCGLNRNTGKVLVADPYLHTPVMDRHYYYVGIERVICSILLGIITYDANLLIIEPKED
jgi:hypothetical protein